MTPRGSGSRGRRLGLGAVALMLGILVVYVILHSPLRPWLDDLLVGDCTFFCRLPSPGGEMARALSALWLIVVAALAAWPLATRAIDGSLDRVVGWGLAAFGLIVIPSALVAGLGDVAGVRLLRPPLGPLLASLPALAALAWALRDGWRPALPERAVLRRPTPLLAGLGLLLALAAIVRIGVAVQHPVTGFDDLGYHGPLAALLWGDGSLSTFLDRFADTPVLSHPGGAELWQGLLLLVGGEPVAMLGQLPFALLAAAGIVAFTAHLGLRRGAGLLAALLFLLAPMALEQSGHVRNDLVGAALVIGSGSLLAAAPGRWGAGRIVLACLGLALMLVTKLALLPAVAALAIVLAVVLLLERRDGRDMRPLWRGLGFGLLVVLLAVGPWWLRNVLREGNPIFPGDIPIIGGGIAWQSPPDANFVPDRLLWPLYPLFEPYGDESGLGAAFAVAILPALVGAVLLARRRALLVIVVLAAVSLPVWWLLDRREPRFLLGLAGLCFALLPFALLVLRRRWRDAGALILGIAALATVGAHVATTLSAQAERPVDRAAFYDQVWSIDPAALQLPEGAGLLLDDRCPIGFGNRLYPMLGSDQARPVARIACTDRSTERIEKTLRRDGLGYVYVVLDAADPAVTDALYPADRFELVTRSTREMRGQDLVVERRLYRWLGGT